MRVLFAGAQVWGTLAENHGCRHRLIFPPEGGKSREEDLPLPVHAPLAPRWLEERRSDVP